MFSVIQRNDILKVPFALLIPLLRASSESPLYTVYQWHMVKTDMTLYSPNMTLQSLTNFEDSSSA